LDNFDFAARFQCAGSLRFRAHALNRSHHVLLLRRGSLAQRRGPTKVFRKIFEHARKLRERLYCRIPGLLINSLRERVAAERRIVFHPESCIHYFIRKSGSAKNLRDERIGIQRDRCD
jgi:hypothetical protein